MCFYFFGFNYAIFIFLLYFYIVEMFLVIEIFKLNNRMVRSLSLSLRKRMNVGVVLLPKNSE